MPMKFSLCNRPVRLLLPIFQWHRTTIGIASLLLAGCYSPYGYHGHYGAGPSYYGQPAYPTPGIQYGPPLYSQPSGIGGDGTYAPGGSPTPLGGPSRTFDGGPPGIRLDDSSNDAPPFNANPGAGRGSVPEPGDDLNNSSPPSAAKPTLTPTSGVQQEDLETPFGQTGGAGAPSDNVSDGKLPVKAAAGEDDPFFELPNQPKPLGSSVESSALPLQRVNYEEVIVRRLSPYGRDTKHANPTWLRGVIDYDQKMKSWSILYAAIPDANDANGGCLTLGEHPNLAKCRLGEVVLAEGAIDSSQLDSRGKPVYVLDNITPLKSQ